MNIDPHIWERPELQDALADQDFRMIFDYLARHEGLSQHQLAKLLGRSQSQISEIVSGRRVQAYGVIVDFAKRLSIPRGLLGVAYYQDLEGARGVGNGGEEDESVERRRLLANGAAAVFGGAIYGIGPVTEFILPIRYHTVNTPSRVGIGDVERVRAVTAFSRWLDGHHGGGSCADILCSQLAGFGRLLNAIVQDKVRTPLFCAVGDAYLVAARAQAELGDLKTARALLAKGMELAEEVHDRSLLATVLINVAHLYGRHGDADDGLKFSQLSEMAMPDGLSAADAMIHMAWLYGKLGIPAQATKYMNNAHSSYEKYRTDERIVPWLAGFNAHGPSGLIEATYRELAEHDSAFLDSAVRASLDTMPAPSDQQGWSIIGLSRAAELHLKAGERAEGLRLAEQTVRMAGVLWVVGSHTREVLTVGLTGALNSYPDSTAVDLAYRPSQLVA
jgi:transcriptional regulator with XRE-family HTH domain